MQRATITGPPGQAVSTLRPKTTPHCSRRSAISFLPRRGISLLEVLITIFVLTVGLLGLAALLPVALTYKVQAANADRSAVCGRAATRDVETRGMLWWNQWTTADGKRWREGQFNGRVGPFVIDPLFVAENGAASLGFPFHAAVNDSLRLPRLTLAGLYNKDDAALSKALAEQVFLDRDGLVFAAPENERDGRPQLVSSGGAAQLQGNYSWMLMVTPSETENPAPGKPKLRLDQRRLFTVTVVVFYKRVPGQDSSPPSERQVKAQVQGRTALLTDPSDSGLLDGLAPNQWIMLSGLWKPAVDDSTRRPLHRWYRIVSVGKSSRQNQRSVTLAGPDWPSGALLDVDGGEDAVATIVDKVVGVFERTVELNTNSLLSPGMPSGSSPAPLPGPGPGPTPGPDPDEGQIVVMDFGTGKTIEIGPPGKPSHYAEEGFRAVPIDSGLVNNRILITDGMMTTVPQSDRELFLHVGGNDEDVKFDHNDTPSTW